MRDIQLIKRNLMMMGLSEEQANDYIELEFEEREKEIQVGQAIINMRPLCIVSKPVINSK